MGGVREGLELAPTSLVDVFDKLAQDSAVLPAVCGHCGDGDASSFSWAELRHASLVVAHRVAAELVELDVESCGDVGLGQLGLVALLACRSPVWLAATLGVLRCGRPFVWMGAGELPSKNRHMEATRNMTILEVLGPRLILVGTGVVDEVVPDWGRAATAPRLLPLADGITAAPVDPSPAMGRIMAENSHRTMCYMLTGGTTGISKCVEVTHNMALHEVRAYPQVAPGLSAKDRVLQHTPVLWAASALGQLDIALTFGATICICSDLEQDTIAAHRVTVLGVAPSSLLALSPQVVPSVRYVFTWGEEMPQVLAERWRKAGIEVLSLLISTEYWLSFVNEGQTSSAGRAIYRAIDGVDFAVLPVDGLRPLQEPDSFGELCLRGAMVTPGYTAGLGEDGAGSMPFIEAADGDGPFFRTRDLVRLVGGGSGSSRASPRRLEFYGRSDQLVKVAGQFVDLTAVERQLEGILGGGPAARHGEGGEENGEQHSDARVAIVASRDAAGAAMPSSAPIAHVFVTPGCVAASPARVTSLLARMRQAVPRGAALHVVNGPLPRDALTGKIDKRALLAGVVGRPPSLPSGPALKKVLQKFPQWWFLTVLAGALDIPSLLQVLLARSAPRWPGSAWALQVAFHMFSMPYLWLLSMHMPRESFRRFINYVPFGRLGLVCLLHHYLRRASSRSAPLGARLASASLAVGTLGGMTQAWRRGRLLPWLLTFWFAVPDCIRFECGWWLTSQGWSWFADQLCSAVLDAPAAGLALCGRMLWAAPQLPARCRELLQMVAALRQPYKLPAALRDEEEEQQKFVDASVAAGSAVEEEEADEEGEEQDVSGMGGDDWDLLPDCQRRSAHLITVQETDSAGRSCAGVPEPSRSDERAFVFQPEWENIWSECVADAADAARTQHSPITLVSTEQPLEAVASVLPGPTPTIESTLVALDNSMPAPSSGMSAPRAPPVVESVWQCCRCEKMLSWGMQWANENGAYFCKPCQKEFDNTWWYAHPRDVVDVSQRMDSDAEKEVRDGAGGSSAGHSASGSTAPRAWATTAEGARLLHLLSPHLGTDAPCASRNLAGIDSLAVLSLCSTLRADTPGLIIRPQDVFECSCVGDLLELVEAQAHRAHASAAQPSSDMRPCAVAAGLTANGSKRERAVWFTVGQYTGTCKWMYGCRGLLDEHSFRSAAARLIARHEGLHAELCDGDVVGTDILRLVKDVASFHTVLWPEVESAAARTPRWARKPLALLVQAVRGAATWSIKGSWPRSSPQLITQSFLDDRVKVVRCRSWAEVEEASNRLRESFRPPFVMALFLLDSPFRATDHWETSGQDSVTAQSTQLATQLRRIGHVIERAPGNAAARLRAAPRNPETRSEPQINTDPWMNPVADPWSAKFSDAEAPAPSQPWPQQQTTQPPHQDDAWANYGKRASAGNFRADPEGQTPPHKFGPPSSYVQFVVSHAYSDGYSGVPLIHDLGTLYTRAEGSKRAHGRGDNATPLTAASVLTPLPHGAAFDTLQSRFFAALEGQPKWKSQDQMSLRAQNFDPLCEPRWQPWCYNHEVLLECGSVSLLRQCSQNYGVPFDVVLLSVVLAAMFRACVAPVVSPGAPATSSQAVSVGSSSSIPAPLQLTLYAPMRDGDLNEAMVGLFSDFRDVTVPCGLPTTVLGFCLDLAAVIRHRRWTVFDPMQNSERILVNILPLDEQVRCAQQFRQTRAHEYRGRRRREPSERKTWKQHGRPMRITLEQEAVDAWWISLDVNSSYYPTTWCRAFVKELRCVLEDLALRPLVPVLFTSGRPNLGALPMGIAHADTDAGACAVARGEDASPLG